MPHYSEQTFTSSSSRANPFDEIEVDVVFERDGREWRVPAFWRGGRDWSVRFWVPAPSGTYRYRTECSDPTDDGLHGRTGEVEVTAYRGSNRLLRSGPFRVSADGRYLEHVDGTPFSWLGDTWWTGMSDRLSWDGFRELTADRKAKGFTAIQVVAGLVPPEETGPDDPGFANEGGPCWTEAFGRINPGYFDFMDRRIEHLVENELAPVIVGAWSNAIVEPGRDKLKQHWRYVVARYGCYPVFWIAGGEVVDPPEPLRAVGPWGPILRTKEEFTGQWTDVTRYLHDVDPYDHPVSVHEACPDFQPVQDESLLDFRFFQPTHYGEQSLAAEIVQLNAHYSRRVAKPLIVAEIGYEGLGATHLEGFQRQAFWLGVLNGAAGHSYGANGVFESYDVDQPLHRLRWSFTTWREGMALPGSRQVGVGAQLLRTLPWWRFAPRPDWVTPGGTTLFGPREGDTVDGLVLQISQDWPFVTGEWDPSDWRRRDGNLDLPYAAGVAGEVRLIYIPSFQLTPSPPPTVLGLEPGIRYRARYWNPADGLAVDLGVVGRPEPGALLFEKEYAPGVIDSVGGLLRADVVISLEADAGADLSVVVRAADDDTGVHLDFTGSTGEAVLSERSSGTLGVPLERARLTPSHGVELRLEVRGAHACFTLKSGAESVGSRIVPVAVQQPGSISVSSTGPVRVEVRESPDPPPDGPRSRSLYTAAGEFRGRLNGKAAPDSPTPGWDHYGLDRILLLDSYLPAPLPTSNDWLLVLQRDDSEAPNG